VLQTAENAAHGACIASTDKGRDGTEGGTADSQVRVLQANKDPGNDAVFSRGEAPL
jgi:hypothetical protein